MPGIFVLEREVLKFPHFKMEKRLFTYKMRLLLRIVKTFISRMPLKEYINFRKEGKIVPGRDKRAQNDKIFYKKILYQDLNDKMCLPNHDKGSCAWAWPTQCPHFVELCPRMQPEEPPG